MNPKLSSISKWAKFKLVIWARLKSMFEESILEISKMIDVFVFWIQFGSKESFRRPLGLGDAFNENKTSKLHNSEILK